MTFDGAQCGIFFPAEFGFSRETHQVLVLDLPRDDWRLLAEQEGDRRGWPVVYFEALTWKEMCNVQIMRRPRPEP